MNMASWGELTLKEKLFDKTSLYFIFFILFYLVQGVIALFRDDFAPPLDIFVAAALVFLFWILHIILKFKPIVPVLIGIGFIPHIIGLYEIFNGHSLYGWQRLDYHYDWIVHLFAMFCYTIAFSSITYKYFKKGFKSNLLIFLLILFFMVGLGSWNEILEYVGYDVGGYGKGFLEFGEGDSSPNGGPWQNSSMDMVCNLAGAFVGAGLFLLLKKYKKT